MSFGGVSTKGNEMNKPLMIALVSSAAMALASCQPVISDATYGTAPPRREYSADETREPPVGVRTPERVQRGGLIDLGGVWLWIDPDTGCHWLAGSSDSALVERTRRTNPDLPQTEQVCEAE